MFHLFEEDEFMANMHTFYSKSSTDRAEEDSLWYIHFLVVLAFGKSLIQKKSQGKRPAGAEFFVRALQLLPDVTALCKQPILSTEILCSMAWYYQALDFRHAAHNFVSPQIKCGMTSLMGLPQSTLDEGVYCQLPSYPGSVHRTAALSMQIKFARIIAEISSSMSRPLVVKEDVLITSGTHFSPTPPFRPPINEAIPIITTKFN
ncbi:hypothetical protein CH063_01594 [Colletotrichum higginsianum]|uniref:Uncharacterized protein n=1 Tax=Colletotrichum higginsianum (strain IMI 349063) TaxID=759273 RepID=H1V9L0_COLHI|nr:hypothetical protein CH063_01594 [Colletotrichum higginsianum]